MAVPSLPRIGEDRPSPSPASPMKSSPMAQGLPSASSSQGNTRPKPTSKAKHLPSLEILHEFGEEIEGLSVRLMDTNNSLKSAPGENLTVDDAMSKTTGRDLQSAQSSAFLTEVEMSDKVSVGGPRRTSNAMSVFSERRASDATAGRAPTADTIRANNEPRHLSAQEIYKIAEQVSSQPPERVEDCRFNGYLEHGPHPLPGGLKAQTILDAVLSTLTFASKKEKEVYAQCFGSDMSRAIMQEFFWWFFCHWFKPSQQEDAEMKMFTRIADNFVALFQSLDMPRKDVFFRSYYVGLAQAVYTVMHVAFPRSRYKFSDDRCKRILISTLCLWTTGLLPARVDWSDWKLNRMMKDKPLKRGSLGERHDLAAVNAAAAAAAHAQGAKAAVGGSGASGVAGGRKLSTAQGTKGFSARVEPKADTEEKRDINFNIRFQPVEPVLKRGGHGKKQSASRAIEGFNIFMNSPLVTHYLRTHSYRLPHSNFVISHPQARVSSKKLDFRAIANRSTEINRELLKNYDKVRQETLKEVGDVRLETLRIKNALEEEKHQVILRGDAHDFSSYIVSMRSTGEEGGR
eukprot:Rmarinus@m.5684